MMLEQAPRTGQFACHIPGNAYQKYMQVGTDLFISIFILSKNHV